MSFQDWEDSKENIQPLKGGRDPQSLTETFKDSTSSSNSMESRIKQLEKKRQDFEFLLRNMENNHPEILQYWWKYIKWIQQNYPSGGKKEQLREVLQRCTQQFKDSEIHKNEILYIKIWIAYADLCVEPLEVFHFMNSNKIGEYVALFYEAWAIVLETQRDFKTALQVYTEGIQKMANPVEGLKEKKKEFEKRMFRKISQPQQLQHADEETADNSRQPLQKLSKKQASSSARQGKPTTSGLNSKSTVSNPSNPSFNVYSMDETNPESESLPSASGWSSLPSEAERTKENTRSKGSWKEPFKSTTVPKQETNQIPIFVDEECQKELEEKEKRDIAQRNIRNHLETKSNSLNPLGADNSLKSSNPSSTVNKAPSTSSSSSVKKTSSQPENFIFNLSSLLKDGVELSFEELRASLPKYQIKEKDPIQKKEPVIEIEDIDIEMEDQTVSLISNSQLAYTKSPVKLSKRLTDEKREEQEAPMSSSKPKSFQERPLISSKGPEEKSLAPITKFNIKEPLKPRNQKTPISKKTRGVEEFNFLDDNTTQVMKFLSGSTPDQIPASPGDMTTTQMTINTRQALQQVMKMFNTPLVASQNTTRDSVSSRDSLFSITPPSSSSRESPLDTLSPTGPVPSNIVADSVKTSSFEVFEDTSNFSGSFVPKPTTSSKLQPITQTFNKENEALKTKNKDILEKSLGNSNPLLVSNKQNQKTTYADVIQTSLKGFSHSEEDTGTFNSLSSYDSKNNFQSFSVHKDTPKIKPSTSNNFQIFSDDNENEGPISKKLRTSLPSNFNSVDPFSDTISEEILNKIIPSLQTELKFHDLTKEPTPNLTPLNGRVLGESLEINENWVFDIKKKIGEGAFAKVFLVQKLDLMSIEDDSTPLVLKVQKHPSYSEFYISTQLTKRIPKNYHPKFSLINDLILCKNVSFLVLNYEDGGTLQDALNIYKKNGKSMPEELVIYYTLEIMHIVQLLHQHKIIHGDIKPDNFLLLSSQDEVEWTPGWNAEIVARRGLQLIDFGRSIDVSLFPWGTTFKGNFHVENFQCPEMLENKPWTYQIDLFGICSVAYCLLHGEYMNIIKDERTQKWKPQNPFKRYWQRDLWVELFDAILNVPDCNSLPDLQVFLIKFEKYLQNNPTKSRAIHQLLTKQHTLVYDYLK